MSPASDFASYRIWPYGAVLLTGYQAVDKLHINRCKQSRSYLAWNLLEQMEELATLVSFSYKLNIYISRGNKEVVLFLFFVFFMTVIRCALQLFLCSCDLIRTFVFTFLSTTNGAVYGL